MGDVKETIYDGNTIIIWQVTQDEPFGELVRQDNYPGENHEFYVFIFQHSFVSTGSEVLRSGFKVKP
jgi:hypothetical protein